jgi:starvation-inducible DNA-binding protein
MAKATVRKQGNATDAMARLLGHVLSDTYVLAVKTHGYHWNVTGPLFPQLHDFFGKQYEALFAAADEIAERIRALGMMPDGSMASFLQNTVIREADAKPLKAGAMIADLLRSHQQARERIAKAAAFADEIDDEGTEDMMTGRMQEHDKIMWMLRSQMA